MSWRDKLQPGSFRGVGFLIDTADTAIGRRVALHEYPLRDLPYAEDLGRRARHFTVECFVLGPDYITARDALINALEQAGPGELVHPYYGRRMVAAADAARVTESTREGGMARFSIPFVEAGEKLEPAASADTAAQTQNQASAAGTILANSFATSFNCDGWPQWVSDAAESDHNSFLDTITSLRDSIPGIPDSVTAFNAQLNAFSDALSSLIRDPFNLGANVVDLILGLGTIAAQPLDALQLYGGLFDFGSDAKPISTATPARQAQSDNRTALYNLVQTAAAVQAAAASAQVPAQDTSDGVRGYATADAAAATRATITDALDDRSLTADDDVYPILTDLRAAVVTDLDTRAAALPGLIEFTPAQTMPALIVAYRLYADANRAEEIVARNALAYPGFATGGAPLQVLSA